MKKYRFSISSFKEFNEFRLWCLVHKPSLLYAFDNPFMSEMEWMTMKEKFYENGYKKIEDEHVYSGSVAMLKNHYVKINKKIDPSILATEVQKHNEEYKSFKNRLYWMEHCKIQVANFNPKEIRFLFWHCPIKCVKIFLYEECNMKPNFLSKLLTK